MKVLRNEKGIALFMVLILSVILLSITSTVLYMVIEGSKSSGREKRYKTVIEAGLGGLDVSFGMIETRGATSSFLNDLAGLTPVITTSAACQPLAACNSIDDYDPGYSGIETKLKVPTTWGPGGTSCWSAGCNDSLTIDPVNSLTYDMSFKLGTAPDPIYNVFVKIVDSTHGNSGLPTGLKKTGVVLSNSGEITVPKIDYLYTVEVLSQSEVNPMERSKTSALYGY